MPRISVIVPAYNGAATIERTLESVLAQSLADWEAIVIDDGSTDTTAAIVAGVMIRDDRVRLVRQENAGLAAARNRGIAEATAPHLLFLDADDTIAPTHLQGLSGALEGADADIAFSGYQRIASDGRMLPPTFEAEIARAPFIQFAYANKVAVHCVLAPRELIVEVGGFDTTLTTCEDWDLWQRLARSGARFVGVPEPTALYHMYDTSMSRDFAKLTSGALEVLARCRRADSRVPRPLPEFVDGLDDPSGHAAAHFLLWGAVAEVASGHDPSPSLARAPECDMGGEGDSVVANIRDALIVGAQADESGLGRVWARTHRHVTPLIEQIGACASEDGLARRIIYQLERHFVRDDPLDTPLALTHVRGYRVDLREAPTIEPGADLLHLRVVVGKEEVLRQEQPLYGGMSAREFARLVREEVGQDQLGDEHLELTAQGKLHALRRMPRRIVSALRHRRALHAAMHSLKPESWIEQQNDSPVRPSSQERRLEIFERAREAAAQAQPVLVEQAAPAGFPPGDYSRTYWESFFDRVDPWQLEDPYEQRKYERALSLLDGLRPKRALEVGCAEGLFTEMLAPRVETLLAVDIAEKAIGRARERFASTNHVRFQQLDLAEGGLPSGFDLTVCSEILYYLPDEETLRRAVCSLHDSLEIDGRLLTLHSLTVQDEPDRTGFDWGMPFGAARFTAALEEIGGLALERSVQTELYRADLWRRTDGAASKPIIETVEAGSPRPEIARTIRWGGIVARAEDLCQTISTRSVPVLMYHIIADKSPEQLDRWRTSPVVFEEQMRLLRRHGFYAITSAQYDWYRVQGEALPGRPVIITFDDGYRDFAETAWPILYRNDFTAEVFVVLDKIGGTSDWDRRFGPPLPLMNWDEIGRLSAQGVAFGSHLATHRYADSLSSADLLDEALRSRLVLGKRLGSEICSMAAPSGGLDERAIRIFHDAGYSICYSTRWGTAALEQHSLNLPRIEVYGGMPLDQFASAVGISGAV